MATITKYISLCNEIVATRAASTYAFPKSTATADLGCGLSRIHKADYNPLTAVYFEAVLKTSTTTRTAYATLVDTAETSVASSVVTTTSATAVRVRSGDISGDAGFTDDQDWGVMIKRNSTTATISIYAARIIIVQTGTISATETHINLGNNEDNYFDPGTSYVDHPYTGLFYWDSSQWDGTIKAYLDMTIEGDAATTATAALVDTADSSVAGTVAGIGDAVLRVRGSEFSASLVNGHTYKIQIKDSSSGGNQTRYDVRLVIQQTGTITKTETYLPIRTTEHTTTATTHTDLFGYFYWDVSEIDVTSYVVLHEATIKCSDAAKTVNVDVNNATDGDLDTRSTSSTAKVLSTSGSLTFTDHTENTAHLRLTATAATGTMSGSHLKIQTSLAAAAPTINVYDSVTTAEGVTVIEKNFNVSVYDSVTATEGVTPSIYNKKVNVYDSVAVSEGTTVTVVSNIPEVSVFDGVAVSEAATVSVTEAGWYNVSWGYRVKVTVLAAEVDADLTDFPVYVDLNDLPAGFHEHVNQTDARDIRVTKTDGTTEVPREVVSYAEATDTGELYFKGDIDNEDDTDFYIYYGNAAASDYAVDDTYGAENVWDTNYKAVWHLKETSGAHLDSTTNDNDSTTETVTAQGSATGQIGGADDFERGSTDYVEVDDAASLRITGDLTISAWIKVEASAGANQELTVVSKDLDTTRGYNLNITADAANALHTRFLINNGSWIEGTDTVYGNTEISAGTFYYVVGVFDQANTNLYAYLDGALDDTQTSTNAAIGAPTSALRIGHTAFPSSGSYFDGLIDEVRISASIRSATWISTEYSNQSSPGTFYTVGTETVMTSAKPSVYDSVAVSENITLFINLFTVSVFDSLTVTENITSTSGPLLVSVYDSVTTAEGITAKSGPFYIVLDDDLTVAETTTLVIPSGRASVDDDLTVTENVVIIENNLIVSVYDSVTTAETVAAREANFVLSVFDSIAVSENVTTFYPIRALSVSDNVAVSENIVSGTTPKFISVYDSTTTTESIAGTAGLLTTVFDSITVVETITALEKNLIVSIFDSVTVSENITALVTYRVISQYDNLTVSEGITARAYPLYVNVFDSVNASENLSGRAFPLWVNVFDSVTAAETITPKIPSGAANVYDLVTVAETLVAGSTPKIISVYDAVNVSESSIGQQDKYLAEVFDSVTVAETLIILLAGLPISVVDNLTVSEGITLLIPSLKVSVFDSIAVSEGITLSPRRLISIYDSVAVSESVVVIQAYRLVNVYNSIAVSESVSRSKVIAINTFHSSTVSEGVTVRIPSLKISVYESITVSESTTFFINKWNITVTDDILLSESLAINQLTEGWLLEGVIPSTWTKETGPESVWSNESNPTSIWTEETNPSPAWTVELAAPDALDVVWDVEGQTEPTYGYVIRAAGDPPMFVDSIGVSESITVDTARRVSVYDSVRVSESVTAQRLTLTLDVHDHINVSTVITTWKSVQTIDVHADLKVSESKTLTRV